MNVEKKKTFNQIISTILYTVFIYLFMGTIFTLILGFIPGISETVLKYASIIPTTVLTALYIISRMKKIYNIDIKNVLSFKKVNLSLLIGYVLFIMGSIYLIDIGLNYIAPFINIPGNSVMTFSSVVEMIVAFIACVIFAPICEETIFRFGFCESLMTKHKVLTTIIISTIIFTILHLYGVIDSIEVFYISILLSIIYFKTKNLIYSIIVHAVNNLIAVTASFWLVSILKSYQLYAIIVLSIFTIIGFYMILMNKKYSKTN
jgi:membrane protease YdiL (CAAX protease family)